MNELFQIWRVRVDSVVWDGEDKYESYAAAKVDADTWQECRPHSRITIETCFTTEWKPAREVSHA